MSARMLGYMVTMTYAEAIEQRTRDLTVLAASAAALLRGKSIVEVTACAHSEACDAANVLVLKMDDGSRVRIAGGYSDQRTGHSCGEYREALAVTG